MVQRMLGAEQSGAARLLFKIDELVTREGKRLGDVFKDYDASGDGHLSRTEISMALSLLDFRPKFTKAEIAALVDFIDADGSGDVDLAEMGKALREVRTLAREIPGGFGGAESRIGAFVTEGQVANAVNVLLALAAERGESNGQLTVEALQKAVDSAGARAEREREAAAANSPTSARQPSEASPARQPPEAAEAEAETKTKAGSVRCGFGCGPTGRLPTVEESMNEEARVAAVLHKKKAERERRIEGEKHWKAWVESKQTEAARAALSPAPEERAESAEPTDPQRRSDADAAYVAWKALKAQQRRAEKQRVEAERADAVRRIDEMQRLRREKIALKQQQQQQSLPRIGPHGGGGRDCASEAASCRSLMPQRVASKIGLCQVAVSPFQVHPAVPYKRATLEAAQQLHALKHADPEEVADAAGQLPEILMQRGIDARFAEAKAKNSGAASAIKRLRHMGHPQYQSKRRHRRQATSDADDMSDASGASPPQHRRRKPGRGARGHEPRSESMSRSDGLMPRRETKRAEYSAEYDFDASTTDPAARARESHEGGAAGGSGGGASDDGVPGATPSVRIDIGIDEGEHTSIAIPITQMDGMMMDFANFGELPVEPSYENDFEDDSPDGAAVARTDDEAAFLGRPRGASRETDSRPGTRSQLTSGGGRSNRASSFDGNGGL